jgi:four helix bundle protein
MKQFRFLDWKVYQDSQKMFLRVMSIVEALPREYRYDIGNQLSRAALSVVLNIAEGGGKTSDKETNRFFEISLGSAYETVALLDTLENMQIINAKENQELRENIADICSQLGGFKKVLKR